MNTHVIILAQGSQKRLPDLPVAKQMLPLPECNNTPILYRTLRQIWHVMEGINIRADRSDRVTVVTWPDLETKLRLTPVPVPMMVTGIGGLPVVKPWPIEWSFYTGTDTLDDPGNSSLKGIARFLQREQTRRARRWSFTPQGVPPAEPEWERTIVLLGDVVYSWACLRAIFVEGGTAFVGTGDLSTSGGELWGIVWGAYTESMMVEALADALGKHPPFTEYQPGQLRRWLWAFDERWKQPDGARPWYQAIDDYTRDIDTPEHVKMLPELSLAASTDDAFNGVTW